MGEHGLDGLAEEGGVDGVIDCRLEDDGDGECATPAFCGWDIFLRKCKVGRHPSFSSLTTGVS